MSASNNTDHIIPGMGFYSNTTTAVPASIAFTQISGGGSSWQFANMPQQLINFDV
jgi:hypothetical protein